jgi:hypothetical protein
LLEIRFFAVALDPVFNRNFLEKLRATMVVASTVALPNLSAPIDTASRALLDLGKRFCHVKVSL